MGTGLSFCPKTRSHDKIELAEELFKYTLFLKTYSFSLTKIKTTSQLLFFNRRQSSSTPPNGRDVYLDFYIEAISQEKLHSETKYKRQSNNSKSEFASLRSLSRDDSFVIKKLTSLG